MTELLERVRTRVLMDFAGADAAHDIGHLDRVAALAGVIAERSGADPELVRVAAYVHDYHRVEEARQGRRPIRPEECVASVLDVLRVCEVPEEWRPTILRAVEATGRYRFAGEDLPEQDAVAAAVHDADNLDAIGAVGIARAFAFGGLLGEPLWDPETALKPVYEEGTTSSIVAHVYEKLVRLEQDMLTEPARAMAADRTLILHRFAADLRSEWLEDADAGTRWDRRTRLLAIEAPGESGEPAVRIGFRGRVMVTFDEDDKPVAVDLFEVPDVLAGAVTRSSTWALDAEAGWVWVELAGGAAHHRVRGTGDVEVRLVKGEPVALNMHLLEDCAFEGGTAEAGAWHGLHDA